MRTFLTTIIFLGVVAGLGPGITTAHADEPTTIVFLTWKPNQPEGWERLVEQFHKEHPRIRIKRQVGPHSSTEYHAIVTQRLRNRDPSVDVFLMDVIWPSEFAAAGWALDLSKRFPVQEQQKFLLESVKASKRSVDRPAS